jgi:hypothetical protein
MTFPTDCYGPHKLALMKRALDAAWQEVETAIPDKRAEALRCAGLWSSGFWPPIREGERDLGRLTQLALEAVKGG